MHCSSMRYGMERESICEKKEEEEKKSKTLPIVREAAFWHAKSLDESSS